MSLKYFRFFGKYGKSIGRGCTLSSGFFSVAEYLEDPTARNASKLGSGFVGSYGGAELGAYCGTAICPVYGTIIGAIIGAILGDSAGRWAGESLYDAIDE